MLKRLIMKATLITFVASLSFAAHAIADTQRFDVPPGDLVAALESLARQAPVDIVYQEKQVRGYQTRGVRGDYSPPEAVTKLLEGTPLQLRADEASGALLITQPQVNGTAIGEGTPNSTSDATTSNGSSRASEVVTSRHQLAQVAQAQPQDIKASDSQERASTPLSEILVTGTHIAGTRSAGSRVLTLDREQIANSGHATVEGILSTLPQNFTGGVAQGQAFPLSDQSAGNFAHGAAVNLRGLGVDSTLVLVDGRRQPAGGLYGAFVDVSSIPTSAIERVEILADGASAVYGSDAVAGVVNFILRKDFDGAETQVRYGSAEGGADQLQASLIGGHSWTTGNAIFGYQYDNQGNLRRSDRRFSASNDLTSRGGSDYRSTFSNPGNILDPATFAPAYAIPSGQDGTSLQPTDLLPGVTNFGTSSTGMDLIGEQDIHSAFVNATQRFGDGHEVFADGRIARRKQRLNTLPQNGFLFVPSTNAFFVDPFGGSAGYFVTYDFTADFGLPISTATVDTYVGTLGAKFELPTDWDLSLSVTDGQEETDGAGINAADAFGSALASALADSDPATAFNPYADGSNTPAATLAAIRTTVPFAAKAGSRNANALASGRLFRIGELTSKLAIGIDYREEELFTEDSVDFPPTSNEREINAAFAEFSLPLIASPIDPGQSMLALSIAGRYEDYSDFGTTFDPRVGLTWSPIESITFRATWGTSFKAPRLSQTIIRFPDAFDAFIPLDSPDGFVDALVRGGNNADLKEETADVWTAGLDWNSSAIPDLGVSLTFWSIDFEDRISQVGPTNNPFGILFEAEEWADSINFSPTREQIDEICRSPTFSFPGNPVSVDQCLASTPQAIVDLRLTNLARVRVEGVDLESQYSFDTRAGTWGFGLNGVYVPHFDRQATRNSPEVDVSNTTGNLLRLRLRANATWSSGGWSLAAHVNYANSYDDTFSPSGRTVDSWTTVDTTVGYEFDDSKSALRGLNIALHGLNVLDEDPPFANVGFSNAAYGYDTANANPFGRILSLQVSKRWGDDN